LLATGVLLTDKGKLRRLRCGTRRRRRMMGPVRYVTTLAILALALAPATAQAESILAADLQAQIDGGVAPPILDVRSTGEFARGHVPGAHHAPFHDVTAHARRLGLDPHAPVIVYCEHGPRAWLARIALRWAGFTDVRLLEGHMSRWRKQGLAIEVTGWKCIDQARDDGLPFDTAPEPPALEPP